MTYAELERELQSRHKRAKREAQEKASYDYILADLIGRSVARVYSSSAKLPEINEVYSSLFDSQDIAKKKQEQKNKLSVLRFKQFAQSFNSKFKGVTVMNEQLKVIISAEINNLKQNIKKAKDEIKDLWKKGKENISKLNDEFQKNGRTE